MFQLDAIKGAWAFKNAMLDSAPSACYLSKRKRVKKFDSSFQEYHFCFNLKTASSSSVSPKRELFANSSFLFSLPQPCLHRPEPSFSQPRRTGCNSPWILSTNLLNWQERFPQSGVKDSFLHRGWLCRLCRTTHTCQPAKQEASIGHHQIWASCLVRIQCWKEHVRKKMWHAHEYSVIFR